MHASARRTAFAILTIAFILPVVAAGDFTDTPYHSGERLICGDCHVGIGGGEEEPRPNRHVVTERRRSMLKHNDVNELCLSCHDNVLGVPDVMSADVNGLRDRAGGRFAMAGMPNPRGHDLGPAGSDEGLTVSCTDCHAPHGNGNPRNLRFPSKPHNTPKLGIFSIPGSAGPSRYESSHTAYGTLGTAELREASALCADCHDRMTGYLYTDPENDGIHVRHPSYDSSRHDTNRIADGAMRGSTAPAHWNTGAGNGFDNAARVPFLAVGTADYAGARSVNAASNAVFCLSCHKAHGSTTAFGLVWEGYGKRGGRAGCDQCHAVQPLPDELVWQR